MRNYFTLLLFILGYSTSMFSQEVVSANKLATWPTSTASVFFGLAGLDFQAKYGVEFYKIIYTTKDGAGMATNASGLVVVPVGDDAFPFLIYDHGTSDGKVDIPSNGTNTEYQLGGMVASLGYIAILPDYLGLGESSGVHPYVHAGTEASAGVDLALAVKNYLTEFGSAWNGQTFVTGYSQGGHAAMATHQLLEESYSDELPVTAAAPMSGPYSISGVMRDLALGDEEYGTVVYIPYLVIGYQQVYGDIYNQLTDIFKEPYASMIEEFEMDLNGLFDLNNRLLDTLNAQFGKTVTKLMLQEDFLADFTNNTDSRLNQLLRDNDTFNWSPSAPTRLFYCTADDQVPFQNAIVAEEMLKANGAADIAIMDVDPTADHGGCVIPAATASFNFFESFRQTVSTKTVLADEELTMYPSLVSSELTFDTDMAEWNLSITTLEGHTLITQQDLAGQTIVNLSALQNGMYLASIESDKGRVVKKFVKI